MPIIHKGGVKPDSKYTKSEFFREIERLYKTYNSVDVNTYNKYTILDVGYVYYTHKYGGIKNICKEIGIPYIYCQRYSKDEIKNDFLSVYNKYGEISTEIYLKHGRYSKQAIKTAFGAINNLMKELGIPLNMSRMDSKEDVINDFYKIYDKYQTTSSTVYRKYGNYSQSVVVRLFGSWSDFLDEINMKPKNRKIGKERMIKDIKSLYKEFGFISCKLVESECTFTYQALSYYYRNPEELSQAIGVDNAFKHEMSTGAELIYKKLANMYGKNDVKKEQTWKWLKNDKTNYSMYVDFYIESISTVVEYDGKQHFCYTYWFHRNENSFLEQKYRDNLKDKLLSDHNIKVIRISYEEKITDDLLAHRLS